MNEPKIVAFSGKSGSGKDSRAKALRGLGFKFFAFADPIKRICMERFGFTRDQLWGSGKDALDERWGITPRTAVRRVGRFWRSFDERWWANITVEEMERQLHASSRLCVTDLRMPWELEALSEFAEEHGGRLFTFRIDSEGIDDYATETGLDGREEWGYLTSKRPSLSEARRETVEAVQDFLFEPNTFPRLQTTLAV